MRNTNHDPGDRTAAPYRPATVAVSLALLLIPTVMLGFALTAQAAIITTGAVSPEYTGDDPWQVNGVIGVGSHITNDNTLTIDDGSRVQSTTGSIGSNTNARGTVNVRDEGSTWHIADKLRLGIYGYGILNIDNGAEVRNGSGELAWQRNSTSFVNIAGPESMWHTTNRLVVGREGQAWVNVTDGARMTSGYTTIAQNASSRSTVNIVGVGSSWFVNGELTVAALGIGNLNIINGAVVDSGVTYMGSNNGADAYATVADGGVWNHNGPLQVAFHQSRGTLNINQGGTLNTDGITIGTLEAALGYVFLNGGTIDLKGGTMKLGNGNGVFRFNDGLLKNVDNINLRRPLIQYGGTFAPGTPVGRTTVTGDYELSQGKIEIELGAPFNQYDQLAVTGDININPTHTELDISLLGPLKAGFYTLLHAQGNITGTFSNITGLDFLPDDASGIYYSTHSVLLLVTEDIVPEPATSIIFIAGALTTLRRKNKTH